MNEFSEFSPEDFRDVQSGLKDEIDILQQRRMELMKERRTIETLMYMLFPKEAVRDGYLSATRVIKTRLSHAKLARQDKPSLYRKSEGVTKAQRLLSKVRR